MVAIQTFNSNTMLINLSNHHSSKWEADQGKAAQKQFQTVLDVAFPAVDPRASVDEVSELALDYASQCLDIIDRFQGSDNPVTGILLAGESTFVLRFVALWRKMKPANATPVPIVCATSERISEDLGNGQKKVTFAFCQFRELSID